MTSNLALATSRTDAPSDRRDLVLAAVDRVCGRIAPLWPLKHFVAVNPFLGFTHETFSATCGYLRRVARMDMLMPRSFYREALESGRITDADLEAAVVQVGRTVRVPPAIGALKEALSVDQVSVSRRPATIATVADVLDGLAAGDRQASRVGFMIDEISKWCAAYFDEGQAAWRQPDRHLPPYAAWRAAALIDRNPEFIGIRGFRQAIASLPEDPHDAIQVVVDRLGIPDRAVPEYLHRALLDIGGWSAYARYRVWEAELYGRKDDTLVQILAIRIAWGYALFAERRDQAFTAAWQRAMREAAELPDDEVLSSDPDLAIDLVLQTAYELAYQRELVGRFLGARTAGAPAAEGSRPKVQAAFCIDVRSEVYRRAFETVCPEVETIGFAGFFGFPIEYIPIGHVHGGAQCPVLLTPKFVVCESVRAASEDEETEVLGLRLLRRRAAKAWKAFKLSAVSSFTFVETAGLLFAGKILGDTLGLTRPVAHPSTDGLDPHVAAKVGPRITPREVGGRATGFDDAQRLQMAEGVLRAMSMTGPFARLVMLTGHGSTTVNNPHATGLDCGACGGHTGEANARVAAAVLNDPGVRAGLVAKGIVIPEDTWFLACLHDTTTDDIIIYDADAVPASHKADLAALEGWLGKATSLSRLERSALLGIGSGEDVDEAVTARSRDWSQVRPEWGLAGNAAFIAAPRHRTRGLDLKGRAFLHEYEHTQDAGYGVLELIMTAPMVVASWINLQYYGSTVNNAAFGSGNKVLHNVVGTLGVLQGNAGDLQVGLPWQSVHDGKRFIHEPLRLNVMIEAPEAEIDRVLRKHDGVRALVDNGWVHLYRITDNGGLRRYTGDLNWVDAGAPAA
jgi:uncharacterized protein YbcC (UPF0753/DUF2309 family)